MKPILFSLGPLNIYSYGALIALGILLALPLMVRQASRTSIWTKDEVYDAAFYVLISGFLGARIFYVFQYGAYYLQHPWEFFAFWQGGLIFYGGFIFSISFLYIFSKLRGKPFLEVLDFLVPYAAFTHAFGRLGCFMNGCCHGIACDLPWAVQFPDLVGRVHPTQLYEALFNFVLFVFLYRQYRQRRFIGSTTALYFIFYGVGRGLIEFFRFGNPGWWGITWNQYISIAIIGVGIFLWLVKRKEMFREQTK